MEGRLFCDVVEIGKGFATIVNGKVIDDIYVQKMVWAALPQNWKERSWLLSHYLYSWRICSGFRGEYFVLFCICSDSGMTGTDIRVGSYR